jgi:hypothetical protein
VIRGPSTQRLRERKTLGVVTIAVGGDGNIGLESMLLLLIIIKWYGLEGTGERRIRGE